jgi:hypothetical protein
MLVIGKFVSRDIRHDPRDLSRQVGFRRNQHADIVGYLTVAVMDVEKISGRHRSGAFQGSLHLGGFDMIAMLSNELMN